MAMFDKVVVPLDGSELAEGVLPHVAEVIRGHQSLVHLLSVSPVTRSSSTPGHTTSPSSSQVETARIGQELVEYLQKTAGKLEPVAADVQHAVRFGRPEETILEYAAEVEADLIAMSTHGRSGIRQWVFGTVADRLLRGATCPVLMVRAQAGRAPAPQDPPTYRTILVPLDGSQLAEQVLPYVGALVRPARTRIFLVSVLMTGLGDRTVTLLTSYPPGMQLTTTALQHAEVETQTYLRGIATTLRKRGAPVQIIVRQGVPAEEILAYADEVGADLITMTTHGLSGVSRWVYGNVARKVLHGAACPVLLVRPTREQQGEKRV